MLHAKTASACRSWTTNKNISNCATDRKHLQQAHTRTRHDSTWRQGRLYRALEPAQQPGAHTERIQWTPSLCNQHERGQHRNEGTTHASLHSDQSQATTLGAATHPGDTHAWPCLPLAVWLWKTNPHSVTSSSMPRKAAMHIPSAEFTLHKLLGTRAQRSNKGSESHRGSKCGASSCEAHNSHWAHEHHAANTQHPAIPPQKKCVGHIEQTTTKMLWLTLRSLAPGTRLGTRHTLPGHAPEGGWRRTEASMSLCTGRAWDQAGRCHCWLVLPSVSQRAREPAA